MLTGTTQRSRDWPAGTGQAFVDGTSGSRAGADVHGMDRALTGFRLLPAIRAGSSDDLTSLCGSVPNRISDRGDAGRPPVQSS